MKKVDIYAFICAVLIVAGWYFYSASVKDNAPATDWFVVRNVSVPDFIAGSDPPVNYDRVIKKEFFGRWSVEVHGTTQSTNYAICTGSGQNHYEPTETLPDTGVSMSWFMGVDGWKKCSLKEGQYVLEITYLITPQGYPEKLYTATSNIFRVAPEGSQLYVTPEQTRTLKEIQQ